MAPHTPFYRQGDIGFRPYDGDVRVWKEANPVLARGEATGHAHQVDPQAIERGDAAVYRGGTWENPRCTVEVKTPEGVAILHETHKPLILPQGHWEMIRQREYDPYEESQEVID